MIKRMILKLDLKDKKSHGMSCLGYSQLAIANVWLSRDLRPMADAMPAGGNVVKMEADTDQNEQTA